MHKFKSFVSNFIFCYKVIWKANKTKTLLFTVINIISAILPYLGIYSLKYFLDALDGIITGRVTNGIGMISILLPFCIYSFINVFTSFFENYLQKIIETQIQDLLTYINVEIMKKSTNIDISYFDVASEYDELTKSRQNAHSLHQVVFATSNGIINIIVFLLNIILSFKINVLISILICLCAVPKILFKFNVEKKNYQFEKKQQRQTRLANYLNALLYDKTASKEIRLFNLGDHFVNEYIKLQSELVKERNHYNNQNSIKSIFWSLPEKVIMIAIKIVVAYYIVIEQMSIGDFAYITGVFDKLSSSFSSVIDTVAVFVGYNERINDFRYYFEKRTSLIKDGQLILKEIEDIEFQEICFSYPNTEMILKNISFKINKYEKCMLVGLNGSGKTTIIKLLARFYEPQSGAILINGIPIQEYNIDSLRKCMATVFQDFTVFSFSIRENVALGNLNVIDCDDDIKQALDKSQFNNAEYLVHEDINLYINREFDENGLELSGGQRQKIAVARAIIRNASFVVLDEPTSSMDPIAENEILNIYNTMYSQKTLLMVSHRLSIATNMDKIIFIEDGMISGIGSHAELYSKKINYKKMFDFQADKYRSCQ